MVQCSYVQHMRTRQLAAHAWKYITFWQGHTGQQPVRGKAAHNCEATYHACMRARACKLASSASKQMQVSPPVKLQLPTTAPASNPLDKSHRKPMVMCIRHTHLMAVCRHAPPLYQFNQSTHVHMLRMRMSINRHRIQPSAVTVACTTLHPFKPQHRRI